MTTSDFNASFITFDSCSHLNFKHTIFGKVVGGMEVLSRMEGIETGANDQPTIVIRILKTTVFVNPFKETASEQPKTTKEKSDNTVKNKFYCTNP